MILNCFTVYVFEYSQDVFENMSVASYLTGYS